MTLIKIVFGRERVAVEIDRFQEMDDAIIEIHRERRRWWRPWLRYEIDGYEDPYA